MPSRFYWRRRLKLLQAKLVLGMHLPEELRDAAMEALHDPCRSNLLVALATLEAPYSVIGQDAVVLFWQVAVEQGLPPMSAKSALQRFTVQTCRELMSGGITTDACAYAIFEARLNADIHPDGEMHDCGDVAGLAFLSFMDRSDFSSDPAEFDRRVLDIARRWAEAAPCGPR